MTRRLHVIGTGGFAKETAQLADAVNTAQGRPWNEIVYLAENDNEVGTRLAFGPVIGTEAVLADATQPLDIAIGIGSPPVRQRIAQRLQAMPHLRFPNLIHPRAVFNPAHVKLGVGNLVTAGVVFTCDIEIGDFNVFNLNATIGHDVVMGSWNVFNPGSNISGNVHVGDACLGGTGCQIIERIHLASRNVLGAGGVLVKSVTTEGGVYAGVPARLLG